MTLHPNEIKSLNKNCDPILDKKQSGLTTERSFINYNRGFLMTFNIICEPNGIFMGFDNLGRQGWQSVSIKMWGENTQKYLPFNFNKCYIFRLNNLQMTLFYSHDKSPAVTHFNLETSHFLLLKKLLRQYLIQNN